MMKILLQWLPPPPPQVLCDQFTNEVHMKAVSELSVSSFIECSASETSRMLDSASEEMEAVESIIKDRRIQFRMGGKYIFCSP